MQWDVGVEMGIVEGVIPAHFDDRFGAPRGRWTGSRCRFRYQRGFGVATECGMGRKPRERVPELLEIQAQVHV